MRLTRRSLVFVIATLLCVVLAAPTAVAKRPLMPNEMGVTAYSYVENLTRVINPDGSETLLKRVAGTQGEADAADKIAGWFEGAGLDVEIQPFTFEDDGEEYESQNVVAYLPAAKKPKSSPTPLVIVGAHYDAVDRGGSGADDNASGVAVMVETARRIAKYKLEYDIVFVAFGAEEVGLEGSFYFADNMTEADRSRAICMINFDSLIAGDMLYIHAGFNEKTWARDEMLRLVRLRKLPIEIQPGLNPAYPAGLTPDWFSDYTAFNQAGIPIAAFESTNWEIPPDYDGYVQTEEYGSFWHTPNDSLSIIEDLLPGRPMVRLEAYTTLVFEFLKHLNPETPRSH